MARFYVGRQRDGAGLSAKSAWKPATKGLRNWRTSLRGLDLEVFETLAGDLLGELSYETGCSSASEEAKAIAAELTEWWATIEAERTKWQKPDND